MPSKEIFHDLSAVAGVTTKNLSFNRFEFNKFIKPTINIKRKPITALALASQKMSDFPPAKKSRLSCDFIPKYTQVNVNNFDVKYPDASTVIDWDHDYDNFCINLGEGFSSAELPKICKPIMDNPIFGRLRYIRQTGVCFYVFPDTSHTRFTHSLGTAVIAYQLVKNFLNKKLMESHQ
jgi:hypothetical protein